MKFISTNIERILWITAIIVIILVFKKCGKGDGDTAKLKAELTAIKKDKQQSDNKLDSIFKKHNADSADWAGRQQLAVIEKQEADSKVKQQQQTIDKLVVTIRHNTGKPIDSSFVLVSPAFKEACEDMPAEIDKLNKVIAEKDTAINQWSDIVAHEVQERDGTIESLRVEIGNGQRIYNRLERKADSLANKVKPRGRLLGGFGVMGNRQQFVAGASGKVGYQDKRGKVYLISGHVMKFNPMPNPIIAGEISVLFKLF